MLFRSIKNKNEDFTRAMGIEDQMLPKWDDTIEKITRWGLIETHSSDSGGEEKIKKLKHFRVFRLVVCLKCAIVTMVIGVVIVTTVIIIIIIIIKK
jgi:hypothetical protein